VNKKAEDDMTALHLACEQGHLELVKLLCSGIRKKQAKPKQDAVKSSEKVG
jgi:ankyrin repeat protein